VRDPLLIEICWRRKRAACVFIVSDEGGIVGWFHYASSWVEILEK